MEKAESQRNHVQTQPTQRQGSNAALEFPRSERIAQLEAMAENSPQAGKLAQLAAMANGNLRMSVQREVIGAMHNSPNLTAQRQQLDSLTGETAQSAESPAQLSAPIQLSGREGDEWDTGPGQGEQAPPTPRPVQGGQTPPPLPEAESLIQDGYSPRAGEERDETAQLVAADESSQLKVTQCADAPVKPNNTGLPDNLKNGIESLSGMSMDSVKVHYNSSQPAQLNALAYAQGTDIHVAPGQERHLPHEAWHVVQQAQGRVKPTMQMKEGVSVNDDKSLEHEADVMGARAIGDGRTIAQGNGKWGGISQLMTTASPFQFKTTIEYGGLTSFEFVRPDKKKTYSGNVGTAMSAHIDPKDAKTGTDTGGSDAFNTLFDALQIHTGSTWVRGHLLNHDLGGVALYNNLFPLTTAANGEHYHEVEKQVKYWVSKGWEVDYQVKAEQIEKDGRGKFMCYAQPTSGNQTDQVLKKTIYSMPYKVESTRSYSQRGSTQANKFSAVVAGDGNTVARDQYKGKYKTHPKWNHKGGNSTGNNREITSNLDPTTLDGSIELENLSNEEQMIISSVNILAELIMGTLNITPDDQDLLEDIVTGYEPGDDGANWLSEYKKEEGIQ